MSHELTIDDLFKIQTELLKAQNKWKAIGGFFGLAPHDISSINEKTDQDSLREMLSMVLNRKTLTWRKIIKALRAPAVQKDALANKIALKYGK